MNDCEASQGGGESESNGREPGCAAEGGDTASNGREAGRDAIAARGCEPGEGGASSGAWLGGGELGGEALRPVTGSSPQSGSAGDGSGSGTEAGAAGHSARVTSGAAMVTSCQLGRCGRAGGSSCHSVRAEEGGSSRHSARAGAGGTSCHSVRAEVRGSSVQTAWGDGNTLRSSSGRIVCARGRASGRVRGRSSGGGVSVNETRTLSSGTGSLGSAGARSGSSRRRGPPCGSLNWIDTLLSRSEPPATWAT